MCGMPYALEACACTACDESEEGLVWGGHEGLGDEAQVVLEAPCRAQCLANVEVVRFPAREKVEAGAWCVEWWEDLLAPKLPV